MDKDQLDEWTMHMAAGTDPLTAYAATRHGDEPQQGRGRFVATTIGAVVALLVVLFLISL